MLPDSKIAKQVYLDPTTGILAGAIAAAENAQSHRVMVCGTIDSNLIREIQTATEDAKSLLAKGSPVHFVDAPVSGGPMGARAGTLAFMVGADSDDIYEQVKSHLVHIGNPDGIFHCGPVGAGVAFKVINNYISAVNSLASSEAMNIGVKMGFDPKRLTKVINASGGQSWVLSHNNPVPGVQENVPSSRNYEGGFRIELCKDVLEMGIDLAREAGARTILGPLTVEAFKEAALDERYRGKDARVVYKWLSEM